ncbi:MAG: glycosyltransferase [Candidatus Heimdallarchaeota archaeon]|nr:glycosyltransferase [Candidatus Heimdallarchaeota archaeon]
MYNLIDLIVIVLFLPLLWILFYIFITMILGKLHKITIPELTKKKSVTIVIPSYNEEQTIISKLNNLLESDYDRELLKIIIVDESTDKTPDLIKEYSKINQNILLITNESRLGYTKAVKLGVAQVESELILLTDSGSRYDKSTIKNLVRWFSDSEIGAVSGTKVGINEDNRHSKNEGVYRKFYDLARSGEMELHSTFHMNGEATMVRTVLAKKILKVDTNFDLAVGLACVENNYKAHVDFESKFYEFNPTLFKNRLQQKQIRAASAIRVLLSYRRQYLFKRKYGLFSYLIFPSHFIAMAILPTSMLLLGISLILKGLTRWDLIAPFIQFTLPNASILFLILISLFLLRHVINNIALIYISLLIGSYKALTWKNKIDTIDTVEETRTGIEHTL